MVVDVWSMAVNIIVEAVLIAVVRSAVKEVAVAAVLVVVSHLKIFCPLSCLLLYHWL